MYRVDDLEKPIYRKILQRAQPYLETRKNDIHTHIALGFALRLLPLEGGDPDVVVPGVILHDVGWSRVPESLQLTAFGPHMSNTELRDVHEREGAIIARGILEELRFPSAKIERIVEIIAEHDSRPDARSIEEAIIKDADKLWRYSREGFLIDMERFGTDEGTHLSFLVRERARWFLTASADRLSQEELETRRAEVETLADADCCCAGKG